VSGAAAKSIGGFLVMVASRMTTTTAVFLLNLFVMVYAMFFFLKDGEKILETIFYYMPLSDEDEALMLLRFTSITRATVKGTLVIGIIQGALAGVALWLAGIDGAAFWGTIMAIPFDCTGNWRSPYLGAGRDLFDRDRSASSRTALVRLVRGGRGND
jgi:predicted PurR-regulated permease PerM